MAKPVVNDGVMMRNDEMMIVRHGRSSLMMDDVQLANGTKVMSDGTVITSGGGRFMLKNGDSITTDGVVLKPGESRPAAVAAMMSHGEVLTIRDGRRFEMSEASMKLNDGSVVTKDGVVTTPDGKTVMLDDGDMVTLDGKIVKSTM